MFSAAERSFLGVVEQAVPSGYRILGKVRIADVLTPQKGLNWSVWQSAFNKISSKHFDYLVCKVDTLEPVVAIELDDRSHKQKKTQVRDRFLEHACATAQLPLLRAMAKRSYGIDIIRQAIIEKMALNIIDS